MEELYSGGLIYLGGKVNKPVTKQLHDKYTQRKWIDRLVSVASLQLWNELTFWYLVDSLGRKHLAFLLRVA